MPIPPLAAPLALTALLLAGPVLSPAAPVLVVADATAGRILLCRPLPVGEQRRVVLAYTHSMYGGDVIEEFVPTADARLRRVATTTANEAAAEYYAFNAPVVRDGDRFRVDVPPADYPELVVRADRIGNHRLTVGDDTLDLVAAGGDRHQIRLSPRPGGLLARLAGDACRGTSP